MKALVVLSGGQDSATCAFWAKESFSEVHAITFNYGQRHEREINAAVEIAARAKLNSHEVVTLGPILKGTSPLTDPNQPLEQYTDFESMEKIIGSRVEKTFVPMRNTLFMTIAANRAAVIGDCGLVSGMCEADGTNYPDCTAAYVASLAECFRKSLADPGFSIFTPLMFLSKAETVALAKRLHGAYDALAYTHTAYDGTYPPSGADHATVLRAEGFRLAEVPDPLIVRAWCEFAIPHLPETLNYRTLRLAYPGTQPLRPGLDEALRLSVPGARR